MRFSFLNLPSHIKPRTRLTMAVGGFVLVHFAAYFLYTATAPYLGSVLGIGGLLLFFIGANKSVRKSGKKNVRKKYYYFKA